ncbi:hypothetical protein APHAL10511_005541 [Amanita phalloides]|nr:hypothetical protein APHAL10511_005541 [Amanita phalloides]
MAPPKLSLASSRMTTRAKNKDVHPGYPDLSSPRRQTLESGTNGQKSTEEKEEEALQRTKAVKKAAALQDYLHRQDQEKEESRATRHKIAVTNIPTGKRPQPAEKRAAHKSSASNKENVDARIQFVSDNEVDIERNYSSIHNAHIFTYFIHIISGVTRNLDAKIIRDRRSSAAKPISAFRRYTEETSSGSDGSNYDGEGSEIDSTDGLSTGDPDEDELEGVAEEKHRELKKKSKSSKKAGRLKTEAMRETTDATGTPAINGKRKLTEITSTSKNGDNSKAKKRRTEDIHGLKPKSDEAIKNRRAATTTNFNDNSESGIQFGGLIPEGQTDNIEAQAINAQNGKSAGKPTKANQYLSVKIEENAAKGNPLKNGARNWLLEHLPREAQTQFTNAVVPRTWKKLGAIEPWANLSVDHVREIVDEVFGEGIYKVERKGPWMGLANARIHNYRNSFVKNALKSIAQLIEDHKDDLNTKQAIAAEIACRLEEDPIGPDADLFTYAYQWSEWSVDPAERKGFALNDLVLRTFAFSHLAHLDGIDDFAEEKPIGALIYSMQAVGLALEHWRTGEPSKEKHPKFSSENFGDKHVDSKEVVGVRGKAQKILIRRATLFVPTLKDLSEAYWDKIINGARAYIKADTGRVRASSAATAVEENPKAKDPYANFKLAIN